MGNKVLAMSRIDGESVSDFHERLKRLYGCHDCPQYDCNGCGSWQVGGYEFGADDDVSPMYDPEDWICLQHGKRARLVTFDEPSDGERSTDLLSLQDALMKAYASHGVSPDVAARCTSYSLWQYMGTEGKVQ